MNDSTPHVLVVDDDPLVAQSIAGYLQSCGYEARHACDGASALRLLDDPGGSADAASSSKPVRITKCAVLITDMSMPDMSGLELIESVKKRHPDIVPLVITGYGTIEQAVECIRRGAIDYLTKPIVDEELRIAVEKAVQQHTLIAENVCLRQQLDDRFGLDQIVGADQRMRGLYTTIEAVAPSRTTVLMCGESGTGKSLIARVIHRLSPRANEPFVEISCGSIPEMLLESELFGHVKGAFTGAHTDKVGKFQAAHGGTLFLDEINSASPAMQLKLLRALQERVFEPVGSTDTAEVDVRVVLASNQPLDELVTAGSFRQDLYYRINVVPIHLPPLRERVSDIDLLATHFLQLKSSEAAKRVVGIDSDALEALRRYEFPGNIRELENIIERAVVLTRATRIGTQDLAPQVLGEAESDVKTGSSADGDRSDAHESGWTPRLAPGITLREALVEPERQILLAALDSNDWNRQKTAEQLDINRTTLYKKMKQFGLDREDAVPYGQSA